MATLIPRNVSSQSSLLFKHIHENVTFYIQRVQFRRVWIYEWKTMPKYQHVSNWSPKINCMPHRDSILLVTQYCSVQFVTLNDWRCHITLARVIVYLLNNLKYEYTVVDNTRPGCGADCSREQHRCSPQLYPKAIAYDCLFWQGRTVWQDKRRGYQCHLVSFFFFFSQDEEYCFVWSLSWTSSSIFAQIFDLKRLFKIQQNMSWTEREIQAIAVWISGKK